MVKHLIIIEYTQVIIRHLRAHLSSVLKQNWSSRKEWLLTKTFVILFPFSLLSLKKSWSKVMPFCSITKFTSVNDPSLSFFSAPSKRKGWEKERRWVMDTSESCLRTHLCTWTCTIHCTCTCTWIVLKQRKICNFHQVIKTN